MLQGKRIYELTALSEISKSLKLPVDNPAFQEAACITVGQLLAALQHDPVTLGTPNGLILPEGSQELSLSLSTKLTAGALSQLPQDQPIYKYINGENKWVYCYANNIVGGHHSYATTIERNEIDINLRQWGMLCTVFNDDTDIFKNATYQLKFNHVDTDITNNLNWVKTSDNLTIHIVNQTEGVVPVGVNTYKIPSLYMKFTFDDTTIYKIAYPQYHHTLDGTLMWKSGVLIEEGYLVLT